ncbi:MAG: methyltransferase domain-containing protein [Nitrososphaerota archaeon]|nr:methyltransferase domain-containing protein [Nitrososphaerota archaeon]
MSSDQLIEMLSPTSGEKILDIGAGDGSMADRVRNASKGAEVYAVEPNEKRVAAMSRAYPAIKGSVARAERLPFPDSYFDKAYTAVALHHFADIDQALHEVVRVLRPGGCFVILEVEPGSTLGRLFSFFGKVMGEHMTMMPQASLLARLKAAGGLEVVDSASYGSRYLIRLRRP